MSEAEPSVVPTWAVFGVVALACLFVAELGEGLVAGKKVPPVTIQSLVGRPRGIPAAGNWGRRASRMRGVTSAAFVREASDKSSTTRARYRKGTTTLVIRSHQMTEGQMERMVQLARACAAGTPPVAFSVSLDTTLIVGERERLREYIASQPNITADDIHIHEYNETTMVDRYPKLPEAQRKVTANGWGSRPAPFGFHTEALGVWFADPFVVAIGPSFVWVIEPDVAYAGQDITNLIRAYGNTDADLVTKGGCVPLPRNWQHTTAHSVAYGEKIPRANRSMSFEFVQRFSGRLLQTLDEAGRLEGMHAWSEQATCSVLNYKGLRHEGLRSEHTGSPFSFRHSKAIKTEQKWLSQSKSQNQQDKLLHPVKYRR